MEEGKTHLHMTKQVRPHKWLQRLVLFSFLPLIATYATSRHQLIRFMTTCKARLDSLHDAVGKSEAYAT